MKSKSFFIKIAAIIILVYLGYNLFFISNNHKVKIEKIQYINKKYFIEQIHNNDKVNNNSEILKNILKLQAKKNIKNALLQVIETSLYRNFNLEQLNFYDGIQSSKIYLSLDGDVFDVSDSSFYKPGTSYGIFGGHDCTLNLARMSMDKTLLNTYNKGMELTENEKKSIQGWKKQFLKKYKKVGKTIYKK
ncbi:Cytochrome b5-like heme/steroid binding domain [Pseudocohnilembus persalinus]|uniref:Cytochrome b5-like heme/steroid binding domain n=1 Tax=Pseudocohnilembus persalinus TaxID=266149 RepID=A0A0V0QN40_PSEPJ|nr:Cytochrome b5-like heme/steroid binding domain [Pseudocohnilembus persalinus]|eukprot:KRX03769.1 Cytochrome b5-like heme/steroid binding domain [Pseudocohnilembus persalinus]